jgi:hypothetical protein
MAYTTVARPTFYNGTQFRSRLEARWAAAFDIIGWEWKYEPYDLNYWVPDFELYLPPYANTNEYYGTKFVRCQSPLVEIRPVTVTDWNGSVPSGFDFNRIYNSVKDQCDGLEILLLGADMNNVFKVPDMGQWFEPQRIYLCCDETSVWREAGNRVQWRP